MRILNNLKVALFDLQRPMRYIHNAKIQRFFVLLSKLVYK